MEIMETITRPWREPIQYLDLIFWVVIFAIVAFVMFDTLRILASWMRQTIEG